MVCVWLVMDLPPWVGLYGSSRSSRYMKKNTILTVSKVLQYFDVSIVSLLFHLPNQISHMLSARVRITSTYQTRSFMHLIPILFCLKHVLLHSRWHLSVIAENCSVMVMSRVATPLINISSTYSSKVQNHDAVKGKLLLS